MSNLYDEVISVLKGIEPNLLKDEDNLFDAGIMNSFLLVEIIEKMEKHFDIQIEAKYIRKENFKNLDSIMEILKKVIESFGSCN